MGVENEFIWGEIHVAKAAFYALGSGAVVSSRYEVAPAAPCAFMRDIKCKIFWELWGVVSAQEGLAEPFGLPLGDHATAPGGDRHGPGAPQDFQLDRGALYTGDAQGDTAVVDLVVAVVFQQGVGYLRQA